MDPSVRSKVYVNVNLDGSEQFSTATKAGGCHLLVDHMQVILRIDTGHALLAHCWGLWLTEDGREAGRGETTVPFDSLPPAAQQGVQEAFRDWTRTIFQSWARSSYPPALAPAS